MDDSQTGAADWRSDAEKHKSLLRKAAISLFRISIPDHPEAAMARPEAGPQFRDAMGTFAEQVTFVSLLSFGSEDMQAHDYMSAPLSLQELLVQREGTDAFLDPRNALRVVRRKFGMMTLIARMASTFEQRNIIAVQLDGTMDEKEILAFARLMNVRVEGTAAEEELAFRKRLRREKLNKVDVLYHSELVGRRIPVPWPVKHLYSLLGRINRKSGRPSADALQQFAEENAGRLNAKSLRQLSLYSDELAEDLDADGLDPYEAFIRCADERLMLTATRSIFDEFRELKLESQRERVLSVAGDMDRSVSDDDVDESLTANSEGSLTDIAEANFLEDASSDADDDDFLRIAQALDRIRRLLGRNFFERISLVSGDVNFVDTVEGTGLEAVEERLKGIDPEEALAQARAVTEPYYQARALAAVVEPLQAAGKTELAERAALEAYAAAKACITSDAMLAHAVAIDALLNARLALPAADSVRQAMTAAHAMGEDDERTAAIMCIVSALIEAGALPTQVRSAFSESILGPDVNFWSKSTVTQQLVEAILALLTEIDEDALIFLRKLVVHPDEAIRRSVLRTLPIGDNEAVNNMLVSHLRDDEPAVRIEVMERIGWAGKPQFGLYLVNHFRHGQARTDQEKRTLALNLARLNPDRYVPVLNAMLGGLATKDAALTARFKPIKDDSPTQLAALEVLYHLNHRNARRLLYNASEKGKGKLKPLAKRIWELVRSAPYGEPKFPQSTHDPEYNEDAPYEFLTEIEALEAEQKEAAPTPEVEEKVELSFDEEVVAPETSEKSSGSSLFGRLKSKLFGSKSGADESLSDADDGETSAAFDELSDDEAAMAREQNALLTPPAATESSSQPAPPPAPLGPPRAGLRFAARLTADEEVGGTTLPMHFALFTSETNGEPFFAEEKSAVRIAGGRFEVTLGTDRVRFEGIPEQVWVEVTVDGDTLSPRALVTRQRSVVNF